MKHQSKCSLLLLFAWFCSSLWMHQTGRLKPLSDVPTPNQALAVPPSCVGCNATCPSTIVTAYYPMKSKHPQSSYEKWMSYFFLLKDNIIIFVPSIAEEVVQKAIISRNAQDRVTVISMELNETDTVQLFDMEFWKHQNEIDPEREFHPSFKMYWVWLAKAEFLKRALELNPYKSSFFAWVDIGFFRKPRWKGKTLVSNIPEKLKPDQTLFLDVEFERTTVKHPTTRTGDGIFGEGVGAGIFGGYAPAIQRWNRLFFGLVLEKSANHFVGKEQPLMYETCFLEENVCLLVRHAANETTYGGEWFFLAPYLILGESKTKANTWVPSRDLISMPYESVLDASSPSPC